MKKITLVLCSLFLMSGLLNAQISLTDIEGNTINNNDIKTFNLADKEHKLVTLITNNSDTQIELKIVLENIIGTDGAEMEFCFGQCYYGITEKKDYPTTEAFTIAANATTTESEVHFEHHSLENDADIVDYTFTVYEVGNKENNYANFTYRFNKGTAGINDLDISIISIYPNPASNYIKISRIDYDRVEFLNTIGQSVKKVNGKQEKISVSDLAKGIYFCKIYSDNELLKTSKLIIK